MFGLPTTVEPSITQIATTNHADSNYQSRSQQLPITQIATTNHAVSNDHTRRHAATASFWSRLDSFGGHWRHTCNAVSTVHMTEPADGADSPLAQAAQLEAPARGPSEPSCKHPLRQTAAGACAHVQGSLTGHKVHAAAPAELKLPDGHVWHIPVELFAKRPAAHKSQCTPPPLSVPSRLIDSRMSLAALFI